MAYLVDADMVLQTTKLHYGLAFSPAFWDVSNVRHSGERRNPGMEAPQPPVPRSLP